MSCAGCARRSPATPRRSCAPDGRIRSRGGRRRIRRATAAQRVLEKLKPVLSPKDFAVEYVAGRTECADRDRVEAVARIGAGYVLATRRCEDFFSVETGSCDQARNGRGVAEILLSLPNRRKSRLREISRIPANFRNRQHGAIGGIGIERPISGLQVKRKPALLAPALQF